MTAVDLDALDKLREVPERQCPWCMATPGEWCVDDCANPDRRCHPSYVAEYAAERGAYSDADAALIVAAVNALPELIAAASKYRALREAVDGLATELEADGVDGSTWLTRRFVVDRLRTVVAAVDGEQ